jgi:hypothetical protein
MSDPTDDETPRRPAMELRRIARYQRWVVAVILAEIALWVGFIAISWLRDSPLNDGLRIPIVFSFILGGVGGVFTFLLYWTIRGPLAALLHGLAAVPPALGTLVLLLANTTATTVLKDHGVRVGIFGAFESDIPDDPPDDELDADW